MGGSDTSPSARPPEGFSRWPPVCSGPSGTSGPQGILEEVDNIPLPFLSRELYVDQTEWLAYLRQHPRFSRQDASLQNSTPKQGKHHKQTEGFQTTSRPGQLTYRRTSRAFPFHPVSKLAIAWKIVVTLIDATYSAFLIPISCAFHWNVRSFSWYNAVDAAAGVIFWLDIFMGFATGYVAVYNLKRLVILDPRLIAEYYIFRGTFFYDLIAALPIIAEVTVLCVPRTGGQTSLHVIFLMRLARMYKVFKMLQWLIKVSLAGHINKLLSRIFSAGQMFLVSLMYAGLVLLNVLTCFWYYVASWEGLSHSWLTAVGPLARDISDEDPVRQYIASFHFVTATVTTVGYGDIAPVSAAEEICAALIMLVGVVFFGFIIAGSQELVQYLAPEARTLSLLRRKMEQVEIWASKRRISAPLRASCNCYFTEVWLHEAELHQSTIFSELPSALQAAVCQELTDQALTNSEVFNVLDEKCKSLLISRLTPCSVPAGHDLCREGGDADCLWIIEEGEVLSIRHGNQLELLDAPAILGETAILADAVPMCRKRPYTLRAVSPCMLWKFDKEDMLYMAGLYPEFMDQILQSTKTHLHNLMTGNEGLFDESGWTYSECNIDWVTARTFLSQLKSASQDNAVLKTSSQSS